MVELAGGTAPIDVDGTSLAPLLLGNNSNSSSRQFFLVEYYGEGEETPCHLYNCIPQRRGYDRLKGATDGGMQIQKRLGIYVQALDFDKICVCTIANNTYHCVRQLATPQTNTTLTRMYCEFDDDEQFKELYEMKADPWQMNNLAYTNTSAVKNVLQFVQVSNLLERNSVTPTALLVLLAQLKHFAHCAIG